MVRNNYDEARVHMSKLYHLIVEIRKREEEAEGETNEID